MGYWRNQHDVPPKNFLCSYCGHDVAPDRGFIHGGNSEGYGPILEQISLCHKCGNPTFLATNGNQYPGAPAGDKVEGITDANVAALYQEARLAHAGGSFTGSVMLCRKILMNVAVAQHAEPGKSFVEYVDWLNAKGFIPPGGRGWVDHIRKVGNEANHEIHLKKKADSEELLDFTGMLLKFVYEMPSRLSKRMGTPKPT